MVNPVITPLTYEKVGRVGALPVDSRIARKSAALPRISIRYQTLEGAHVEQEAHSSWAALLQHECDHLDGVLYPMRMEDLSLLAFNEAPGALAEGSAHAAGPDRPPVSRPGRAVAGPGTMAACSGQ
jgi:peptide deformylase